MTEADRKKAAKAFAEAWKDRGYEKGESQAFWLSLLHDVFAKRKRGSTHEPNPKPRATRELGRCIICQANI